MLEDKNPDRVEFVDLPDGTKEYVTVEELETVDEWLDQPRPEGAR